MKCPCRPRLCAELTRFDDQGNKMDVPDKERQIEAFQLLFMLLPPANRSLLKLLMDLLYHTARNQHVNKMSALNLATMFAPHIIWPKHVRSLCLTPPNSAQQPSGCLRWRGRFSSIRSGLTFCVLLLQVMASDLQGNIDKLNKGIAFLIRHSQKLFKVNGPGRTSLCFKAFEATLRLAACPPEACGSSWKTNWSLFLCNTGLN